MISRKELKYVNLFARQSLFPGTNYAEKVFEKMIYAYELYQKKYLDKEYSIIFSNGEEIDFEIMTKNLAHLLGIDSKNLTSEYMIETVENVLGLSKFEEKNSYELLKRIIERYEDVIKNDSNPNNSRILNYYKVMIKCAIFSKFSDFGQFNFGCINFDRNIYNNSVENVFSSNSTKLLLTESNESITPYFMMGIKDGNDEKYFPETLFAPENYRDLFVKQELVIPTQILCSDNNDLTKIEATTKEKLSILNTYKRIIVEYNTKSTINIQNDYENMLKAEEKILIK